MAQKQEDMTDNKEGQTHFQLPIDITDREVLAIQEVIDAFLCDERIDCESWRFENGEGNQDNVEVDVDEWKDGEHVYYSLKKLQNLLDRITKKTKQHGDN